MSESLTKLINRYSIAKKFNYKISLDNIELTDDVIKFIETHDLIIDKTRSELEFTDDYENIHILSGDKLQEKIKQEYNIELLFKHKSVSYPLLKNKISNYNEKLVKKFAGAYFNNIKYIWINLKGIDKYKQDSTIEKRVCLTISHERIHHELDKINRETSKKFDNIAKRLRYEGYGV